MKADASPSPVRGLLPRWGATLGIGAAVFLSLAGLQSSSPLQALERATRDWRTGLRSHPLLGSVQSPTHLRSDRIVVVPIDDATLQAIEEPLMLWTRHFASVLGALDRAGATAVALDLQLVVSGEEALRRRIEEAPDRATGAPGPGSSMGRGDLALFQALRGGSVLLLAQVRSDGSLQAPWPPFRHAAGDDNLGLGNVITDSDGVVRRQLVYRTARLPDGSDRPFFHLSVLTACRALGVRPAFDGRQLTLGERPVPHDSSFTFAVNYLGPPGAFLDGPSFGELVQRARAADDRWFRERFHDRVVIVGPGYAGSNDLVMTPTGGARRGEMLGVELQANSVNTLLNQDFLVSWPRGCDTGVLLTFCLVGALVCGWRGPAVAASVLVTSASLWVAAGTLALCRWNVWVDVAAPLLAAPAVFAAVFTWRYRAEYRTRRHLRRVLGRYVSENVAREILEDPARLALGGSRREVSILFCDLNGFTDMSEQLDPEQVIATLNDYFTRMERVIFRHGGTLKQFVGDEIMVICGAPAADPCHATTACRIALDMERELLRWRQERREAGRPALDAKLGIHSGAVVAGNVGSPNRTEYATVGDVVNTASRIMGLCKRTGRRILVSADTCCLAGEAFAYEDLGWHEVRGRSRPVRVLALGEKAGMSDNSNDAPGATCPPAGGHDGSK